MRRMMTEKEIATVESLRKDGILSLKDAQGNPRFVEGDITINSIEGVTKTYGKWSLSGTHLMIVVLANVAQNTTLARNSSLFSLEIPSYIFSKISPIFSSVVERKTFSAYNSGGGSQTLDLYLYLSGTSLLGVVASNFTTTDNRTIRIQFDLLIDTDYDE